jgi:hypothetical protein
MSTPTTTTITDYFNLTADALAKLITDEYAVILANERTNLPKALAVGEKLIALRQRVNPKHGEWQDKLEEWCPTLSYETATKYIRLYEKWPDIEKAAAAKNVATTDLTIEAALSLIAKKRTPAAPTTAAPTTDEGKPTPEAMEAKQAANAEAEAAELEDVDIDGARQERVDWIFAQLMKRYPQDELLDLTERLAKHLGMRLMPADTLAALQETLHPTQTPPMQPLASSAASGFMRRG